MKGKENLKKLASTLEKSAKKVIDTAVHAADQNADGKFDFADIAVVAESVGDTVKKGAQTLKENADEKARLLELKTLQPIFPDTLDENDFLMPKFIRITERDKKYIDSQVCQGSVGYTSNSKDLRIVNIFRDSLDTYGLSFYPDCDDEFYFVDPSDRDRYISLSEYFYYLKIERINELQRIAQDLGAKYFKVTYKEEKASFVEKKAKANARAKSLGSGDLEHNSSEKKYSTIEIAAEMECPGHTPVKPQLKYLHKDPSIQTLISMRLNEKTPLLHQKYLLKMSNSSGMKESDAIKIDAVLKGMKYSGNTTIASEAKNEARRYLEYEIKF